MYHVGAITTDGLVIWLRATREPGKRGPIPRATFATMAEAQTQADKRTKVSRWAFAPYGHEYKIWKASKRAKALPAFDEL